MGGGAGLGDGLIARVPRRKLGRLIGGHRTGNNGEGRVGARAEGAPGLLDEGEDEPRAGQQLLSLAAQADPAWPALEQGRAEVELEVLDPPGQRRLGQVQAPRGADDGAFLGDGDQLWSCSMLSPGA